MKNFSAIILLFIANSISGIAQGISMIAIPWYFTAEGALEQYGVIYVITSLISLIWVPYSGTFIDRFNRKKIYMVVTLVCGSLLLSIALLGYYWGALPWYMVALVFMITFFNYNIHYPNLYAFIQEITEKEYYGKVTSYIEIQGQLSSVFAGACAAMLLVGSETGAINLFGWNIYLGIKIVPWSIYEIFLLDAGTYFVGFLIILLLKYQPIALRTIEKGSLVTQLKIGFTYLQNNKEILLFGIASYSIFVAVLITTFFLAAPYVKNHLLATGDVFAASEMYFALGAVFAGIAIRRVFKNLTTPMAVIIMTLATFALFLVLGLSQNMWLFFAMMLVLGIANAGTRILRVTYLFSHIPNQVYGRAGSIFFLSHLILRVFFLSLFSLSFFHQGSNIVYAFGIMSLFLLLTAFVLIYYYRSFVPKT
ncbi:MAG: MFS transporter [Saprospiraceae bacterium]